MPVRADNVFFVEEMILPSGRTRQFDVDEVLDRALEVFWRAVRGCHPPGADQGDGDQPASSTPPSGIRSSCSVRHSTVTNGANGVLGRGFEEPTARAAAEASFRALSVCNGTRESTRGASSCPGHSRLAKSRDVRRELAQLRQAIVKTFRERFNRAVAGRGSFGGDRLRDARTVHRQQCWRPGSSGGQRDHEKELRAGCALAMQAWPT